VSVKGHGRQRHKTNKDCSLCVCVPRVSMNGHERAMVLASFSLSRGACVCVSSREERLESGLREFQEQRPTNGYS
jgi:hypothetical protein